jgi:FKBP-type peptidyl-prolyl cis-trans isomerase FkpA
MFGDLKLQPKFPRLKYIVVIILFLATVACTNNSDKSKLPGKPGKAEMEDLNRYMIQKDRERIENYIERKNLKMTESPTGLWYKIINQGDGDLLTDKSEIKMTYDCCLLDGTKCYSSENMGIKKLILGSSTMEAGLNEGLRLLKPGAKAIFILPPYMAYGLPGDGKKIPPRAVIVYNVNIFRPE